ncbi:hypothetical protein DSCW_50430 [Desulfosarcina widdelii]|uniref:DUF6268 domain-containing protein n=1 Tax=Desulfosarcina widdelii TaxID=947919 RepID=A0A5K7Z736_9BACT|nr:DUF6268 family outer membrane beta-barrel protein [Desulfosarcina widdelii]BBO77626.1 hypothetical protein DSCW_50430 [Desulfosarcina widdelii]
MRCPRQIFVLLGLSTILTAMAMTASAHAQSGDAGSARPAPPKYAFSFSYTPVYQFETDLDSGGEFDVERHFFRFDVTRIVNRQWAVGLGLSFDYERWDFSGIDGLAGIDLWDEIVRPGISLPIAYTTANQWRLMVIPSVEFAGASGAETDESLSYGAVISAMHAVGPNLKIGVGAGVFNRLDEWEAFPFLAIDWKIDDRFKVSNPFRAGIAGPAGLELVYTPTDRLELGVGGAFRSYRFRLDDSNAVPDGIGEVEFWAAFLRIGWRLGESYRLDINGGACIDGKISIDDEDGNDLGETGTDTAPFVGITLKGRF